MEGGDGNDTFVLKSGAGTDTIIDFQVGSDSLVIESVQSGELSFDGQTVMAGEEILANIDVVNDENMTVSDFDVI